MKTLVSRVSLLIVALHLAGTISIEPALSQATIPPHLRALDRERVAEAVPLIEQTWENDYEQYFRTNFPDRSITAKAIADSLSRLSKQTGKRTALLYIVPRPERLELVLVTPERQPIHKRIKEANRQALLEQVQKFTTSITNASIRNTTRYLPPAQQLYQWMIAPLEADLKSQNIDTLLFCVGPGIRSLPLAALHDGRQFLIEKYSYSRIPAFKLTDITHTDLRNSPILAMGASQFKDQLPLPAVPVELSTISQSLRPGKFFLNQEFTLPNLQSQRQQQSFKIIHLATHADFQPGAPSNSFIQFWDIRLTLDKMRQLRWNNPPVDLLVLSACKTAIGDKEAELGFAGLAVQARVKSAIASLWNVSDQGTLGLMIEFYRDLKTASIKAEALQQAQIAMLKGQVRIENGQLRTLSGNIPLPPALAGLENEDLSIPYYWAGFTVVGSPW